MIRGRGSVFVLRADSDIIALRVDTFASYCNLMRFYLFYE